MNVSTLCLAILSFGEASGYDIRKMSTEGSFSHFVDASFGAIYPALDRLEKDRLVTRRVEAQDGKPARNVFAITQAGHAALIGQLMEPIAGDKLKSEFLLLALCAEHLPKERIAAAIEQRIAETQRMRDDFAAQRDECDHPASKWVLGMAVLMKDTKLAYLKANGDSLAALGQQPASEAAE